ncbi:MAG: ribonuclease P protein component [Cyclobacteriaceae bacterium]
MCNFQRPEIQAIPYITLDTENTNNFNFPKNERLSSKKLIDNIFLNGKSLFSYPFSIKYLFYTDQEYNQVLISVSKKKFKRAVDRNLIKRRIKEAYRLNKSTFLKRNKEKGYLLIAYIYIAKEIHDYSFIESKLIETLKRLNSKSIDQ